MKPGTDFHPVTAAKGLLRTSRSGALATLMAGTGAPYCSLVNVASDHDGAPLMLLSQLAVHTRNFLADPRVSLMLDERRAGDPLEGARIMIGGTMARCEEPHSRARYLRAHPEAQMFAGFADFALYRLQPEGLHLVAGFGRIVDLKAADVLLAAGAATALAEAEEEIVAHLNADHGDTLNLYATRLLGGAEGLWQCAGCDPEGLDLELPGEGNKVILRLPFPELVSAPAALQKTLKRIADTARGAP